MDTSLARPTRSDRRRSKRFGLTTNQINKAAKDKFSPPT
jgi:hypothetical protein